MVFRYLNLINHEEQGPVLLRRDKIVCMLSLFGLPLLFFVCALSLFVRTPYLHMGSALQHHIFTWALLCTSTTPRFAPLVPCVLSLFGLTLLFFVYSLFLVCPCCSLCAFSFWFAPVVLWVLSLFGFPLLFYVLSLFCLPLLFMCSLLLCTRHLFSLTPLCTSTIPRFSWDCT